MDIARQIATFAAWHRIAGKLRMMEQSGIDLICDEPDIDCIDEETDIAVDMYQIRRNRYPRLVSA